MEFARKRISVIMGIYNCEQTLMEAVQSLMNQTFSEWNLIMCDDGSSDNTFQVAEAIEKKLPGRVLLLRNRENKGLNYTLNKCLEKVNGEYVARMDADDICSPSRFEKEAIFLDTHPEYAFVSSPMVLFDDSGEWGCDWGKEKPDGKDLIIYRPFCHAACMIRTEALQSVGGYSVDRRLLRVEDLHLWMKLYEHGFLGYNIQEPLYMMRDDRNAYQRRRFKYRINESYVNMLTVKKLKLNPIYMVYAIKPVLIGLLPPGLYDLLHKSRLKT